MLSAARIMPVGVRLCAATSSGRTTTRANPHQLVLDAAAEADVDTSRPDEASQVGTASGGDRITCKLITIRSKKSFAEVTDALESLFKMVDLQRLADMTAAGDQAGIHAYFEELSGDHEFSIFFKLDQGSTQRLAGIPIDCRFYLIGNAVIVNGLFRYGATAGLGAPVRVCISQNEGEQVRIDLDEPTAFFNQ
ncbi:MAG: hypothetical protein QOD02_3134, partial [Mycobacterium sp.]|nr:hypothetical protein [Mycobacterium sp.]